SVAASSRFLTECEIAGGTLLGVARTGRDVVCRASRSCARAGRERILEGVLHRARGAGYGALQGTLRARPFTLGLAYASASGRRPTSRSSRARAMRRPP